MKSIDIFEDWKAGLDISCVSMHIFHTLELTEKKVYSIANVPTKKNFLG